MQFVSLSLIRFGILVSLLVGCVLARPAVGQECLSSPW